MATVCSCFLRTPLFLWDFGFEEVLSGFGSLANELTELQTDSLSSLCEGDSCIVEPVCLIDES